MHRKSIIFMFIVICIILGSSPSKILADEPIRVDNTTDLIAALETYDNIEVSTSAVLLIQIFEEDPPITIPEGTTVTFLNGGYTITNNSTINNHGTIINEHNNFVNQSNGIINNFGTFINKGNFYIDAGALNNQAEATFDNQGTLVNNSTINNSGAFHKGSDFTNNGEYIDSTDRAVEVTKDDESFYFSTLEDAITSVNLTETEGQEIRILEDITIDGDIALPRYDCTLSGLKDDGRVYTLTVNNGDYNLKANITLKNIKIAGTGSKGDFYTYDDMDIKGFTVSLDEGVEFDDVTLIGSDSINIGTGLYVLGDIDLSSQEVCMKTIYVNNGSTLRTGNISTKDFNLNSGSHVITTGAVSGTNLKMDQSSLTGSRVSMTNIDLQNKSSLKITGTDDFVIDGTLTTSGSGNNILILPTPTEHSGIVYSMKFGNTANLHGTAPIEIQSSGTVFSSGDKVVYLGENTGITSDGFVSNDPDAAWTKKRIDGGQYITLIHASSLSLSSTPAAITYGDRTTLEAAVTDGGDPATSGTVKFYQGTSVDESKLLGIMNVDSDGKAQYIVHAADYKTTGNVQFYALYEDDAYDPSEGITTVVVNPISLGVSSVEIRDKIYDGTAAAQIDKINLSHVIGDDEVTADAEAIFTDPNVGSNKTVHLSEFILSGAEAYKYMVEPKSLDILTTAKITKMIPTVQLQASPESDIVPGDTVTLTANIQGASGGTIPTGNVIFYKREEPIGTADCISGQARLIWNNVPEGICNLSAAYNGDANYSTAVGRISDFIASKFDQDDLIISGIPTRVYRNDTFALNAAGGSGSGVIGFAVTSGASINIDERGVVTAVGLGESTITVTKKGDSRYRPNSTRVTINVINHAPTVKSGEEVQLGSAAPVSSDGTTTAATYTGNAANWFEDADGDTITYRLISAEDNESNDVTDSVDINDVSGDVQYTPQLEDADKTIMIVVKAYDGIEESLDQVSITVIVSSLPPNSVKDITGFSFTEQMGTAAIKDGAVNIEVVNGTDVTSLVPIITVSENAVIEPLSGEVQDFTSPVTYIVTAEDGSTKEWVVTVTAASSKSSKDKDHAVSSTDQILIKATEQKENAVYSLQNGRRTEIRITPELVKNFRKSDHSILIENEKAVLTFSSESLITDQLTQAIEDKSTKLELGVKAVNPIEKHRILENAQIGESTGLFDIGGKIYDLTAQIVDQSGRAAKIDSFAEPVAVTIDLSDLELTEEDIVNLTGIRYEKDKQGNIIPVKLGGSYDEKTKKFTFYTDGFSLYSIVKTETLTQIGLIIGDLESTINGKEILNDVAPIIIHNRTMVPIRFIAENMGAKVDWVDETRTVIIKLDQKTIQMIIGEEIKGFDVPPTIVDNRTLVPIRYVSEKLGATVLWFPETQSVSIVK